MKKRKNFLKKSVQEQELKFLNIFKNNFDLDEKILDIPLKYALFILGFTIFFTVFILLLTYFNVLDKLKPLFLSFFDVLNYTRYSKGSTDIGVVLASLVFVLGISIIHPIFGICGITLIRCWLDGYTYPTDNTYFVWATIFISLSYIIRTFLQKQNLKFDIHTISFFLFIIFLIILLSVSQQVGKSYRHFILWASYALLFFALYGSIKTTSQKNILTWVIIITLGLQTWYAFFHFQYVLPFLRKSLMMDPTLRMKFFGTTELSKELIYRFNINRAFGTMLFPNALGGFIVLFLPVLIYWFVYHIYMLYKQWQTPYKENKNRKDVERGILIQTAIIWLISTIIIYATELFPLTYTFEEGSNLDSYITAGFASIMSLFPSGLFAWICIKKGNKTGKYFIFSLFLFFCVFFSISSLYLTYSRGSWLSLFLSLFLLIIFALLSQFFYKNTKSITLLFLSLFIVFCFIFSIFFFLNNLAFAENTSQQVATNKAAEEIMESGVGVSWEHLSDPSSFRLRWSYWKVGLNMWFHNFFTGVGLGNFALAYPHYQYLGAGDVKECHNGYLQMLCETGILGGIFFILFICAILYKIVICVKENKNFYGFVWGVGILAFLIHAGLDIHFSHPSLVTYFLIGLVLFLNETPDANANKGAEIDNQNRKNIIPTIVLISTCVLLFLISLFPYTRDLIRSRMSFLNVGKDTEIPLVLKSINYVFTDVFEYAINKSDKQPKMSATILKFFFVDLNKLRIFGNLYVPEGKGSNKATLLPEGNPVPDNAVLLVKEPWLFINRIRNSSINYANYLKQVDKIFPYQEDIPNYLCELYKLIFLHTPNDVYPQIVNDSRKEMLLWAEEAIRRSPYNGDLYYNYGKVLWFSATKDCPNPDERNNYVKIAIENFEKCALLWRNVPFYWLEYIAHMKDAVRFFESNNQIEERDKTQEKIDKATQYVNDLIDKRKKLNLW